MTSGVRVATKPGHASCVSLCASEVEAAEQTTTHRAARKVRHNAPIETLLDPSHAGRQRRRLCRCAALAKHPSGGAAVPALRMYRVSGYSAFVRSLYCLPDQSRQFCAMMARKCAAHRGGRPRTASKSASRNPMFVHRRFGAAAMQFRARKTLRACSALIREGAARRAIRCASNRVASTRSDHPQWKTAPSPSLARERT